MNAILPVYDLSAISTSALDDIEVKRFAAYLKIHPNLHKPHKHSFYHMVFFTQGAGSHTIDFDSFAVQPGQAYFMIPGQVHGWNFAGTIDGYVINFSPSFIGSFLNRSDYLSEFPFLQGSSAAGVVQLSAGLQQEIYQLMEKLVSANEAGGQYSRDYMRVLLLQVFICIARNYTKKVSGRATPVKQVVLNNFLKLVDKTFMQLRQPKDYAEQLYITANHLNALCRDMLNKSAGDVIRNRTALEAKRLLINLDLSVAQIGYTLGFKDNSYFTRFFKKQTGTTPEQFRKEKIELYENR